MPDYKSGILSTADCFGENIRAKHIKDEILVAQIGLADSEISLLSADWASVSGSGSDNAECLWLCSLAQFLLF